MKKEKIAITTSGGDCAGINSAVASFVRCAIGAGYNVVGIEKGLEGLLNPVKYIDLDIKKVRGISHLGGTILESVNKGRFGGKKGEGEFVEIKDSVLEEAAQNLKSEGIDKVVIIGGDGSLSGAKQLQKKGIKVIGLPKSIDNDLDLTDITIGFDSAVHSVMESLEKLHTTADSHDRVFIVETMGRYTGWLSLYGGIAGGAQAILIPEIQFEYEVLIKFLRQRVLSGSDSTVIVVAEGVKEPNSEELVTHSNQDAHEVNLGGISKAIENKINALAPLEFEIRTMDLGHLQRGGEPTSMDRNLGLRLGYHALRMIKEEKFGRMLAVQNGRIIDVDIDEATKQLKKVERDNELVFAAKSNGICFGDELPPIMR